MNKNIIRLSLAIVAIITGVCVLTACGAKRPSENMELKRSLHKLTKHFPEFDDMIVFYDAAVEDDAIVVMTTLDQDFYGNRLAQGLDELWHDPEWKEVFKEKMAVKHSHLINLAKSADIDMCWRFFDEKGRDWFDLRLNADESDRFLQSGKEKAKLAEEAHLKLNRFIKKINSTLPNDIENGLSIKNVELQPNLIIYNYEVDENKTSHKKLEGRIIKIGKEEMSRLLQNGIEGDSLLITAADAHVGVTYRFKGSKTGYVQDYEVLTAKELKNLKAALD